MEFTPNTKLEQFKSDLKDRQVTVLGIGISNTPLIKFLADNGAKVTACDRKTKTELGDTYDELAAKNVTMKLGEGYLEDLSGDLIFKTPGMRFDIPELEAARQRGSLVTSEMEVFFDLCPAPIIAVTGSDGKTTTTTLIDTMLKEEGYTCHLGGNIGKPLLPEIENMKENHKVVVELSSFQLQTMRKSPKIAVVTNVSPNHLDIHKSMEEYIDAKRNIYLYQTPADKLVVNQANDLTRAFGREAKGQCIYFSSKSKPKKGCYLAGSTIYYNNIEVLSTRDIALPGLHNVENYMAAICAVWDLVSISTIATVAKTFMGVPHRIEFVREIGGVKFYNDSIASSPTRAMAGLKSFSQKLIIIAGGYDKHIPFDDYGMAALDHIKHLVLVGATKDAIKEAVSIASRVKNRAMVPVYEAESFEEAVLAAYKAAEKGDIVMLSPACASFDLFKNFEERGEVFKKIVAGL